MSAAFQRIDFVARAYEAWGDDPPEFILELAVACRDASQTAVAKRIGYSSSVVSQAISRTYRGDMNLVEERVRGALMQETVRCPVLVEVTRDECHNWQKKPFASTSGLRVKLYRACRSGCPHSRLQQEYD
ncbi:MAG: transcriptional regulator [Pseudomonadota bacterium]